MEEILAYLRKNYAPLTVIVYGSYADGSNNENSDFDALVISKDHEKFHDVSFIEGIQLDVFVYPALYFEEEIDCEEFIQISDGVIVLDSNGIGLSLKNRILSYLAQLPHKTDREVRTEVEWCKKMLLRTKRDDAEGMFRWHWLLADSLEIFCDIRRQRYSGPKKSLKRMETEDPQAFEIYGKALRDFSITSLENWVFYLEKELEKNVT